MKTNKQLLKRIYTVSSFLVIAAFLLTACSGAFSFQGSANPNEEGGLDVSGGAQPETNVQPAPAAQPAESEGLNQTTMILIFVGIAFFILILVLLITRGRSRNEPPV